ncbi:MAG: hypothetical protein H6668_22585 [Ardenticatenaceae bacterium]|nr:hypothetical protein [Ardenticatenaceae bacterium]
MVWLWRKTGLVEAIAVSDPDECLGAGTRSELVDVEKAFRRRANGRLLAQGVTLIDPDTIYIDQDVKLGRTPLFGPTAMCRGKPSLVPIVSLGQTPLCVMRG